MTTDTMTDHDEVLRRASVQADRLIARARVVLADDSDDAVPPVQLDSEALAIAAQLADLDRTARAGAIYYLALRAAAPAGWTDRLDDGSYYEDYEDDDDDDGPLPAVADALADPAPDILAGLDDDIREFARLADYLQATPGGPEDVPPGRVVVHNHVRPQADMSAWPMALNGFRAWTYPAGRDDITRCGCNWAPGLPEHYRMAAS